MIVNKHTVHIGFWHLFRKTRHTTNPRHMMIVVIKTILSGSFILTIAITTVIATNTYNAFSISFWLYFLFVLRPRSS